LEPTEKKPTAGPAAASSANPFNGAKDKGPCAGRPLAGKSAIFIVDDYELKTERTVLHYCFDDAASNRSVKPEPYSTFLSNPSSVVADAIILRSSRTFIVRENDQKALLAALGELRKANPKSAIIVCAIGYARKLDHLLADGTINVVDTDITSGRDESFLRKADEIIAILNKE
jgi:hypothetical protein